MLGMGRDSGMESTRPASSLANASAKSPRTSSGRSWISGRQAFRMMITTYCLTCETYRPPGASARLVRLGGALVTPFWCKTARSRSPRTSTGGRHRGRGPGDRSGSHGTGRRLRASTSRVAPAGSAAMGTPRSVSKSRSHSSTSFELTTVRDASCAERTGPDPFRDAALTPPSRWLPGAASSPRSTQPAGSNSRCLGTPSLST